MKTDDRGRVETWHVPTQEFVMRWPVDVREGATARELMHAPYARAVRKRNPTGRIEPRPLPKGLGKPGEPGEPGEPGGLGKPGKPGNPGEPTP